MNAKKRIACLVPVVVILLLVVAVIHPLLGYSWSDPEPSADSLALEARRKLESLASGGRMDAQFKMINREAARGQSRGTYIIIDTHTNRLYLRKGEQVVLSALCSTGTGAELVDTGDGRHWQFDTPKGFFRVDSKVDNPWWRKPDWAFIEEGKPVPKDDAEERLDPAAMGDYAIGFGNGFFVHGTLLERLIGVSVTHGCVRMRSGDLKQVYQSVRIGTPIIVY